MHLLELTLTDFGVYRGTHTFDLKPRSGPIVIVGGKNGAGKTTLLEAICLCLYGPRALGSRTSQREYDEYVMNRIHRRRGGTVPLISTAVRILFEHVQLGYKHQYEVTRSWRRRGSLRETLVVRRNGSPLTDFAEEHWQDFIQDLVPPGLAELFFFDGEKIQSLATDNLSEYTLAEAIKQLLNLDILERLQADLDIYLYRQRKDKGVPELARRLEGLQRQREVIESEYQALRQDRSQTEAHLAQVRGQIEDQEQEISRESSGFALIRDKLKEERAQIEAALTQVQHEIHSLSAGLLPFALVPNLCVTLKKQLIVEAEYQRWKASRELLQPRLDEVQGVLHSDEFWHSVGGHLSHEIRSAIADGVDGLLNRLLLPPESVETTELLHHVAEPERLQLLNWIGQSTSEIPDKTRQANEQLERLTRRRQEIVVSLRQVPEDDVLAPLLQRLNELHQRLGELEAKAMQQERELEAISVRRQEVQRQLIRAYEELKERQAKERRLELISEVQKVLADFLPGLTREKTAELQALVTARFNELCRKPDLLRRVTIDPQSFAIILYDCNDQLLSKDQLSAGEKQIFAIAILWALRQLSGRPLPVVIDTPLGRLDSEHRYNLVTRYFPYTSHQVILFSTDTEVDRFYFDALKSSISHAYHLNYDSETGSTEVEKGYFWREVRHAAQ